MSVLTFSQLSTARENFMLSILNYYPFTFQGFELLNAYGFRWIEIFELSRWSDNGDGTFTVITAKGSNDRIIDESTIPSSILAMIRNGVQTNDYCRYNKLAKIFNHNFDYYDMYHGSKQVSVHFFRYFIAKYKKNLGWSDSDIKAYLGEVSQANANLYIYGNLETNLI